MRILSVYCYIILILYSTHAYTQAQITDMRLHTFSTNGQPAETLRLEIDLNAPAQPTLFTLKSPHRLVIDLKETQQPSSSTNTDWTNPTNQHSECAP